MIQVTIKDVNSTGNEEIASVGLPIIPRIDEQLIFYNTSLKELHKVMVVSVVYQFNLPIDTFDIMILVTPVIEM